MLKGNWSKHESVKKEKDFVLISDATVSERFAYDCQNSKDVLDAEIQREITL